MKRGRTKLFLTLMLSLALALPATVAHAATTITSNQTGTQDGYDYELWKDSGTTSMTLNSGGTFSAQWSGINNALFRKGKKFDSTKTHGQIGTISINYNATFNPGGNSYLCVYGWTKDPLVEYYIVDNWGTYRPTGTFKGTISVDGGTYDIYETTRVNQPSIIGTATFKQYWSVRQAKRSGGTISVSEHFKKWESLGMTMGKMYEVALTVEGYQSSGSANVTSHTLSIGGSGGGGGTPGTATKVEAEAMTKGGSYTSNISSPFTGVALYGNNDLVKFTQNFTTGTHSFSLRGASSNSTMARVDLKIGGVTKGTFYFGDSYPAVYTISNVSHGTGNQEIQLVCTSDNGTWDVFLDYLEIN
ncbi:1,4-beta-xylanase [Paenibacillus albicereus]|uniref:Endo-1,4-beta-xylanase n=1 Tax=Paenibacillus albicereus TaxID=2726185 RepID=A0A6H2GXC1_9BACL|nr:glycoside hydrolase family 11 protein [Paenibacillus albicereus]QJC52081.1 1,4-beta-xylanase [Paenibacillus albicereus]